MADYKGIIKYKTGEGPSEVVVEEYPLLEDETLPVVVSLAGPFNLATNNTLTTCSVGAVTLGANLNLATGAVSSSAVTCAEVVARINGALSTDPARIVNNHVVIEGAAHAETIAIAGNACLVVFGETTISVTGTDLSYATDPNLAFLKGDFSSKNVGDTIYYHYTDCNSVVLDA